MRHPAALLLQLFHSEKVWGWEKEVGQNLGCHGTERSEEGAKIREFVRLSFGQAGMGKAERRNMGRVGGSWVGQKCAATCHFRRKKQNSLVRRQNFGSWAKICQVGIGK